VDLSSRLRAIVRSGPSKAVRELTYEPDTGRYEATLDVGRVAAVLGGQPVDTPFGRCLVVDRRYEPDRWHGGVQIGDCEVTNVEGLRLLDPSLFADGEPLEDPQPQTCGRTVFIDLETTGLSGGAGTVAFLVGCGFFDLGAFQVRQFLLTSHAAERALLSAVAQFFEGADLIVTFNGKSFDVPVMETRWQFHRIDMPLEGVTHFDMLHPARRLWKASMPSAEEGGCRLTTLERALFEVRRIGDVPGLEIPRRYFHFLRSGDPRPLEAVLEHNRLDLVSLAAVMGRAVRLAREGHASCRDSEEALALGRVLERAGAVERAEACYHRAAESDRLDVKGEALYRLGLRCRRDRRYADAAAVWREVLALTEAAGTRHHPLLMSLRQFAAEALAIHHEHRDRDLCTARELALFALEDADASDVSGLKHRVARLDRKIQTKKDARQLSVL
jgi:uncharacterized protein YprB with RNaseH-like and TPR domain